MRQETIKLIKEKAFKFLAEGATHKMHDPSGQWLHLRDLKSIVDCESKILTETLRGVHKRLRQNRADVEKDFFKIACIIDEYAEYLPTDCFKRLKEIIDRYDKTQ